VGDFLGAFALIKREQRYLFVANERQIHGASRRVWDLPGGRVEPAELLHEALRRELREETRLEVVGAPELAFVQEGERLVGGLRRHAWRSFFFIVDVSGEPRADSEVLDVRWMTEREIHAECSAPYHDSFRAWLERGGSHFISRWEDAGELD